MNLKLHKTYIAMAGFALIAIIAFYIQSKSSPTKQHATTTAQNTTSVTEEPEVSSAPKTKKIDLSDPNLDPALRARYEAIYAEYGVKPYPADQVVDIFNEFMARIAADDPSLTHDDLYQLENGLSITLEQSPVAQALLTERLEQALVNLEPKAIFTLERVFGNNETGNGLLVDLYKEMVQDENNHMDYYALQGLTKYPYKLSNNDKIALTEVAFNQLEKYTEFSKRGPALNYLAATLESPKNDIPFAHRESAVQMVADSLRYAQTFQETFFSAQALYRITSPAESAQFATETLLSTPNKATVLSALESIELKEISVNDALKQSLRSAIQRQSVSEEELVYVKKLMPELLEG